METYAHINNIITVRMFFAVFVQMDLKLEQMDVVPAFICRDPYENKPMEVREGLKDPKIIIRFAELEVNLQVKIGPSRMLSKNSLVSFYSGNKKQWS